MLSEMSIITEYLECVFIEVNTKTMTQNKKIIVGIVYRPPSTNITTFTEHVMNIIDYLKVENKQCYIITEIETRIYNEQATTTTFKESIDQITWDEIYASINPQESYSKFLN